MRKVVIYKAGGYDQLTLETPDYDALVLPGGQINPDKRTSTYTNPCEG